MRLDSENERRKVQNLIVKNFSNISSVDISKVLSELLKLMEKMSYILMIMVLLVSISGVLVVIAINYQQFLSRRTDIKLMKLIGTPIKTIIMIPLIESMLLSVTANVLGVGVGLMSSFILAKYVFDGAWSINYMAMVYIFIAIPLICCSISIFLSLIEARRKYKELEL